MLEADEGSINEDEVISKNHESQKNLTTNFSSKPYKKSL